MFFYFSLKINYLRHDGIAAWKYTTQALAQRSVLLLWQTSSGGSLSRRKRAVSYVRFVSNHSDSLFGFNKPSLTK